MLSPYGRREWSLILLITLVLSAAAAWAGWWILAGIVVVTGVGLCGFFRDPPRRIPSQRGQVVSPADGRVRSVHEVDHFEPFDGPAVCVRIFLSVFNVHVTRSPCHGRVVSTEHKPGQFLNALKPESAEVNESQLTVLRHTARPVPIAAVKQISGTIARRIVCATRPGDILQRGQRFGLIKFGSTTELYLPHPDRVSVQVSLGQKVAAGSTVIATVSSTGE